MLRKALEILDPEPSAFPLDDPFLFQLIKVNRSCELPSYFN